MQSNNMYYHQVPTHCPSCGKCNTCGRPNEIQNPVPAPQWTWTTTPNIGVDGGSVCGAYNSSIASGGASGSLGAAVEGLASSSIEETA